MKKITFTLVLKLLSVCFVNAQVSFSKAGTFSYWGFRTYSCYMANGPVFYSMEMANDTDIKFTIFNDDLTENRSFVIENCINNKQDIMLVEIEPYDIYDTYCYLTQTLFNTDDKFEVLRIVYEEFDNDWEITGIEVVSEDGNILGRLPEGLYSTYLDAFTLGTNNYLALRSYDEDLFDVYAINENGSNNISFKEVKSGFAYPNPVRPSKSFTVQLEGNNLGINSYIEITDMNGRIIDRQTINGEEKIEVSTRKLRKGQYIYNVISDDKKVDSGKIIVQ